MSVYVHKVMSKYLRVPACEVSPVSYKQIRLYSAPSERSIPQAKRKYVPDNGSYPKGFYAGSTHVGIKPGNTKFDDLMIIGSNKPCSAAAVFTQNKFQAAPVTVSRNILERNQGQGFHSIVVNSGCANAVTGKGGIDDAQRMVHEVDRFFNEGEDGVKRKNSSLVMSTGVIGQRLPINKIVQHIPTAHSKLGSSHHHWMSAARAICTTDTFPKLLSQKFSLPSTPQISYSLAGMTKGAGMIHPNMATLLGIICTDVAIAPQALKSLLDASVDKSFNSISIDGDTSTNDTLAILANGAAGGQTVIRKSSKDYVKLQQVLTEFAANLAKLVVRDGEGATKFVTIRVKNAASYSDAKKVASTIARSPLVKSALYGKDANWGRILCAVGYADGVSSVVPSQTSVSFVPCDGSKELKLLVNGEPEAVDEDRAADILKEEDLEILVKLGNRKGEEAVYWTCDLSHEYVTINADYRT